jgi:hypothetical protein
VMSSFSRQIPFRPYKPSQFMVHLFTEAWRCHVNEGMQQIV